MKAQGSRLEKQLCENSKNLSSTMHLFAAVRDAKIKKILIQRFFLFRYINNGKKLYMIKSK